MEAKQQKAAISEELKNKRKEINKVEATMHASIAKIEGLKRNQHNLKVDINNLKLQKTKFNNAFRSNINTNENRNPNKKIGVNRHWPWCETVMLEINFKFLICRIISIVYLKRLKIIIYFKSGLASSSINLCTIVIDLNFNYCIKINSITNSKWHEN